MDMKAFRLPAMLLVLVAAETGAQQLPGASRVPGSGSLYPGTSGSLFPTLLPSQSGMRGSHGVPGSHGFHRGFFPGFYVEREYVPVIEREVIREVPAEPPEAPPPPPEPRRPYVIGRTYSSLPPNGCMKMIQGGASYFQCSGEWYREVGRSQYKAVSAPL